MEDYKNYLAANVLSEDRVISYRLLSRALKVNVNSAKEMLYEFHQQQNAKKPGTIHATYLISGSKLKEISVTARHKDGEDEYMQSSPFMSSSLPQPSEETGETSVLSISLVREEDLESMNMHFLHTGTTAQGNLQDLQLLSDCTREVQSLSASEDPLEYYPKYGTIINPQVKRRPNRRPPPVSAPIKSSAAAKPKPTESAKDTTKPPSTISVKQEAKQQGAVAKDFFGKGKDKAKPADTSEPSSKESTPVGNAPTLKKESSSIFKAFAKAKPKLKSEGTESSVGAEDEVMTDAVHFDEDEEETYVPPVQREESAGDRKSRKEREAKLRAMMEEDDDEESHPAPEPEPELELEEEEETILENEKPKEEPEPVTTTVKDDEGYLVTIEEPAWESFSEDEPAPPPMKARPPLSSTSGPKGKKVPEKKGQGSIMSFFGKK
ncbi:hypothetical protein OIDMADRAFT_54790 [Oidiodendron maius Zn]|uniref:DNA polymerase delta subunit 3 n=1 Tax=Oidiodendron maius (strain Zn) TaxID=913774 RepID=A0A0C3HAD9_OIDMZ|nr:hypothetical protein OIDMADRAFT_54790 [Oidiodendron maius Zn]